MNDASSYIVPMNTNNIIESNRNSITDKPHNNKPITKIEISPGGRYLVTYSQDDHSVVGWNIDVDEGQLKPNDSVKINYEIKQICVSDDKKLAYINNDRTLINIIDIRNNNHFKIDMRIYYRLKSFVEYFIDIRKYIKPYYCTFNSKGEFVLFVLYRESHLFIYIYSTQTNNNKLKRKRIYELPEDFELTELITRYDKLYLFSNDYAYEWDTSITGIFIRMFGINTTKNFIGINTKFETKNVRIFSNDKFICLKIEDEIIVYSIELRISIATLDINNDIQLYNFMKHTGLCLVLLQLFDRIPNKGIWKSIMDYCWKESLDRLNIENPLPNNIRTINNYGFGILDGNVWKIKVENVISKINFPLQISDEIIENWYDYSSNYYNNFRIKEDFEHLNAHLFSPYMNAIRKLFDVASSNYVQKRELEFNQWKIKIDDDEIELQVLKDKWYRTSTKFDCDYSNFEKYLISSSLFDNGDVLILTTIGLFIYHFNEDNKSISLNYYYHMYLKYLKYIKLLKYMNFIPGLLELKLQHYYYYKKLKFSTPTLPLLNYESFKLNDEWTSYLIDNKSSLLKYGVELLSFSIKEHKLELIEDIYKKCIIYFRQDLRNNSKFLSIITSTMPLLNEHFPEYILRYSLETAMIIDSPIYNIEHRNINLHLYSFFKHPPKVNLVVLTTYSILWSRCMDRFYSIKSTPPRVISFPLMSFYYFIITMLLSVLLPFLIFLFFINNLLFLIIFSISILILLYFYIRYLIHSRLSRPSIPTITFMISYIKFVNYPRDYNYIFDLFWPKPSPFVNIINRDIYKTWNGEALINFKWNTYGKYYYFIICILFMALLGCFTAVATIPQDHLNENLKRNLLKTSITLGSFHLIQEIRQFIYSPKKWFLNYWNFFDLGAYLIPTATSIYWLHSNNENTSLLSFSCLLLDIKLLLFFRAFESFGIYFAIIVGVAKQLISFLVILFIIIISFAHAFLVLLKPKLAYVLDQPTINDDPNNPWNLNNQINGTTAQNASFIQAPDENTNMFTDYGTALFAIYLFLTGDPSALSNKWPYKEHPALVILIVLFSFMIVVFLMNLFIGLLNIAIEKDNNRISYLMQKAEILAEIELFYLLPCQRRWKAWFPEVIHYYADVVKTREKVKEMISKGEWNINDFPELKKDLLDKLNIQYNPANSEIIRRDA